MYASGGFEPGLQAIINAANTFNFRPGSQRHFLIITDEDSDGGSLSQAISICNSNNIVVHGAISCGFGSSYAHYCNPSSSITGATGGLVFSVVGPYNAILNKLGEVIANTYVVRYRTDNPNYDGQQRTVVLEATTSTGTGNDIAFYTPGSGPQIARTQATIDLSYNAPIAGQVLTIEASITDNVPPGVTNAKLYYKHISSGSYTSINMTNTGGSYYSAQIPSGAVNSSGVQYYITATDGQLTSSDPAVEPGNNPYNIAVLPNIAPVITHTPITEAPVGDDIEVAAEVQDGTNAVADVICYYRKIGTLIYTSLSMTNIGGDSYICSIPGSAMTQDGIDYYIKATDDLNVSSVHGPHAIQAIQLDLTIETVHIAQVLDDVDINNDNRIDLVEDKNTAIIVFLSGQGLTALSSSVEVMAELDGQTVATTLSAAEYQNLANKAGSGDNYVVLIHTPGSQGDYVLNVRLDPDDLITEVSEDNNSFSADVSVKDTHNLVLTYVPVQGTRPFGGGYGPIDMTEYGNSVSSSASLIQATFPVATNDFTHHQSNISYWGNPVQCWVPGGNIENAICLGIQDDLLYIYIWAKLLHVSTDRAVGIVPVDYFDYHNLPNVVGIANPNLWTGIARVGRWSTPAHEIGHTYGLRVSQEEYNLLGGCERGTGYWVNRNERVTNRTCFMCSSSGTNVINRWICETDYSSLFRSFRKDKDDPEMLLITGYMYPGDSVEFREFYHLDSGTVQFAPDGAYTTRLLDGNGEIVGEYGFDVSYQLHIDPVGIVETDVAPFALAIPFPDDVWSMQVIRGQAVLIQVEPSMELLHDAVDLIPDSAFLPKPETNEERRLALHNTLEAVEVMIAGGKLRPAIKTLQRAVGTELERWLRDDFIEENPLFYDKDRILNLLNEVISRLEVQQ